MDICGVSRLDEDNCYEIDSNSLEWSQDSSWLSDRGLQKAGDSRVKIVEWSMFFEYISKEWEVDFIYQGIETS
jgi:hypothetical protein